MYARQSFVAVSIFRASFADFRPWTAALSVYALAERYFALMRSMSVTLH